MVLLKKSQGFMVLSLVFMFSVIVFSGGCGATTCEYTKDDINLKGFRSIFESEYRYEYLRVGKYHNISTDFPRVYLLLGYGETVFLPEIGMDWIRQKIEENRISYTMNRSGDEYGEMLTQYNINGCDFFFRDNRLIVFGHYNGLEAIISERNKRYDLPLSYKEVVELFGKEDALREYYGK